MVSLLTTMNLIFALVFNLCITFLSCRSIKYIDVDHIKNIFEKQSSPTERDNQKFLLNALPFNKEWGSSIDRHILEKEIKKKDSVPIAIIVATPERSLDQVKNNELMINSAEGEELTTVAKEPKDIENQNITLYNDKEIERSSKSSKEQIEDVSIQMESKSNTNENNNLKINNDLLLLKPSIEVENQLEKNMIIQNTSKTDIGSEGILYNKEEPERTVKDILAFNPEIIKTDKESASQLNKNVNEDDFKTYRITYVLNKYVFVK